MLELSRRSQVAIGIVLVLLVAMNRGSHFSLVNLPSASWAVFFLAGVLLKPRWVFPLLFLQTTFMDIMSVGWTNAGHHCMTVAYWMLLPAYAALWFGGRLYARWHREQLSSLLVLIPAVLSSALVCQLFSSGGFYFFSGRYDNPTFSGMLERIATYYPQYLSSMALYVGAAAVIYIVMRVYAVREAQQGRQA
ncbi:hypothetical protein [Halopseudomonas pelagia]|uniref:Cobalamin ABC transporter n=1 Tax=Halopseudomonas pelagia TaxID=553151 RepID=A0AA91Z8P5_9GAMM|nr:hypothetical protein [Halopseudomonas pelagia]PCD01266.1 hypothetical protein CO192_01180 [Halopseudomonas pelagia]QFY57556.1 hypothetical protein EAO82_14980 [Halopseudomonas pelagia]